MDADLSLLQALLVLGVMQSTRQLYVSLTAKDATGEQFLSTPHAVTTRILNTVKYRDFSFWTIVTIL